MAAWRYKIFQLEKINLVSPSNRVIFLLLHKIFTIHNNVCGDSEDFRPLSEDFRRCFSKIGPNARRTFLNISQRFPDIF